MTALTGGCLCGSVRYRATTEPMNPHMCHCTMCQRASGAPMVGWISFPLDRFAFTSGEPTYYRSSPGIRRGFCVNCGSALVFHPDGRPRIGITLASLDHPEAVSPKFHIYDTTKWVTLSDGLPSYPAEKR
ncbi:MAG: GFA family protein [Alphaproteobacteria bacterium]|nr:GFA family protein [Alphaproteobacteria bacterium]